MYLKRKCWHKYTRVTRGRFAVGNDKDGNRKGSRKMSRKEVDKVKDEKIDNCNKIKVRIGILTVAEDDVCEVSKQFLEDLYNTNIEE